jgi:DnaK suppressor protein
MPTPLTTAQVDELRRRLEGERDRIQRLLRRHADAAPQPDQETELEEAAQRETERANQLQLERRERALLGEVERALSKIARGEYGIGENTGEPIPYARLAAIPWARESVDE